MKPWLFEPLVEARDLLKMAAGVIDRLAAEPNNQESLRELLEDLITTTHDLLGELLESPNV